MAATADRRSTLIPLLIGLSLLIGLFIVFILFTETRSDREFRKDLTKHIRVIENSLWLLDSTIENVRRVADFVRNFKRISVDGGKPYRSTFDISELLTTLLDHLGANLAKAGHRLEFRPGNLSLWTRIPAR